MKVYDCSRSQLFSPRALSCGPYVLSGSIPHHTTSARLRRRKSRPLTPAQSHLEATADDATAVKALSARDEEANRRIESRLHNLSAVQARLLTQTMFSAVESGCFRVQGGAEDKTWSCHTRCVLHRVLYAQSHRHLSFKLDASSSLTPSNLSLVP